MLLYLVIGVIVVLFVLLITLVVLGLYHNARIRQRDHKIPWHRRY